ncbi:hypothetical protein J2W28_002067 [Variovorax boronicumulans]|uniref:hypothetical protein n=1 Tax=Variovorax boronicumulans TaxID=436515 RepID=UPI002788F378|nr:hypothetical protein [Variovorax boronicumulans]MDP9990897.1 hypothetical protein [Variovorax boronicumulans]MDQ0002925.1 hypothetical protein [Variovorax boronicumulans]
MKVNANKYLHFLEFRRDLLRAIGEGHSVIEFTHTWGGDSGYGNREVPRLEMEFEARVTRINGDAVPRIKQSKKATKKETTK